MNNKNNNSEYSAHIQGFHSVKEFEEVLNSRSIGSELCEFDLQQQNAFHSGIKISNQIQNKFANGNAVLDQAVPLYCQNKNMLYLNENFQVQLDSQSVLSASPTNQSSIASVRCSPGLARRVVINNEYSADFNTAGTTKVIITEDNLKSEYKYGNHICNNQGDTYVGLRLAYSSSSDSLATSLKDSGEVSLDKPFLFAPPHSSHFNDDTLIDIPLSAGSSSPSHSIPCNSPQLPNNLLTLNAGVNRQQVQQLSEFTDVSINSDTFNRLDKPIFLNPFEERNSVISSDMYSKMQCPHMESIGNTCGTNITESGIKINVKNIHFPSDECSTLKSAISPAVCSSGVYDFDFQSRQQEHSKLQFGDPLWIKQDSPVYRGQAFNSAQPVYTENGNIRQSTSDLHVTTQVDCFQNTAEDRDYSRQQQYQQCTQGHFKEKTDKKFDKSAHHQEIAASVKIETHSTSNNGNNRFWQSSHAYNSSSGQPETDFGSDEDTDKLLQKEYDNKSGGGAAQKYEKLDGNKVKSASDIDASYKQLQSKDSNLAAEVKLEREQFEERRRKGREVAVRHPDHPTVLIEGVLFRASYLGSTQLMSEGQPSKATRMMQAQEAVGRIKAPEDEHQPSVGVDLFISTEKIMVLNTNLQEIMMDHALKTISYIADIGDVLVIMARRRYLSFSSVDNSPDLPVGNGPSSVGSGSRRQTKIVCHVFESGEASLIAQSIGHAFQVAYMEFLRANGIEDPGLQLKDMDYQDVLNQQEIHSQELILFSDKQMQKVVIVPKSRHEPLGVVIVESGWGSMIPTVVLANMNPAGPAARCGQLNIGDQIISVNDVSCVGLPLVQCQNLLKNCRSQSAVKLTIVSCPPVVEVLIKRPDVKYQLGFSVQNGVICSLLRGGIAERGGVRVGHRIIEINGQSVVAVPHERVVNMLATGIGEIHMKTMPTSIFRLLTGQEVPHYI